MLRVCPLDVAVLSTRQYVSWARMVSGTTNGSGDMAQQMNNLPKAPTKPRLIP